VCGRYSLTRRDRRELAAELGVPEDSLADYQPHYNIAPTQTAFVMKLHGENRELMPAKWGLVNSWARDNSRAAQCINSNAETSTG